VAGAAAFHVFQSPKDLRTSVNIEKADLGIPGITKVYNATVTNFDGKPVRITRCDFMDDTMSPGTMVAYAIQRWDKQNQRWEEVVGTSTKTFCHPYPLGIVRATLVRRWLWPGQSLEIGEEATAARDGLQIGDKARFVIFTATPGDYSSSVATEPFVIDEHPTTDADLRVRH